MRGDRDLTTLPAQAPEPGPPLRPASVPDLHPDVAAALDGGVRGRIARLAELGTRGEGRGIATLATRVDTARQLEHAAARLGSVLLRNAGRAPGEIKEGVAIVTGFQVIDGRTGRPLGGENDGPAVAAVLARFLLGRGTPVALVTDTGSQAVVAESLAAAGLAGPGPPHPGLTVHVADRDAETQDAYTGRIRRALVAGNMSTLVVIERPGPNAAGRLNNMAGQDVTPFNADLSGLLLKDAAYRPYTVAIGDGGNELGLGALHRDIAHMRHPNGDRVVRNGDRIAASPDHGADAVILNAVSSNGGLALAMAIRAVTGGGGLAADVDAYDGILRHLERRGLSIDGVTQRNRLSVDGRPLGTAADSRANPARRPGQDGATHHDTFREMLGIMAG